MPTFNKINNIIIKDDEVFLLATKVITMHFDDHLNAFSIEEVDDVFRLVSVDDLLYYRPYDRQFSPENDENVYIVPYCSLV